MRNIALRSVSTAVLPVGEAGNDPILGIVALPDTPTILVATRTALAWVEGEQVVLSVPWLEDGEASGSAGDCDGPSLVSFELVQGIQAVGVFDSGDIVSIDVDTREKLVTPVPLPSRVIAAGWHPAHSLLTLVLEGGSFVVLDSLFDVVAENELECTDRGLDELVTVGWGSEMTQFQGSVGKAARETKQAESRVVGANDSKGTSVEWRADGEFFLINYYHAESGERRCATWNDSGALLARVLRDAPLGEASCIRPIGNIMALASKGTLAMAERNGERRNGVVDVNGVTPGARIISAAWNVDGSILAVHVAHEEEATESLQLWTCSNLDWTCKMALPHGTVRIQWWSWDTETADVLSFVPVSPTPRLVTLKLALSYTANDEIALSVASRALRLTNYARVVIPPPMAETTLEMERLAAIHALSRGAVGVVDVNGDVTMWCRTSLDATVRLEYSMARKLPPLPAGSVATAAAIDDSGSHFALAYTSLSDGASTLVSYDLSGKETSESTPCASPIVRLEWTAEGELVTLDAEGALSLGGTSIGEVDRGTTKEFRIIGDSVATLSTSGALTLHGRRQKKGGGGPLPPGTKGSDQLLLSKAAASFAVHSSFIVWVDSESALHVRDTEHIEGDVTAPRPLEKGARVVAVAPPKVILQMPRGNLETIQSRFFLERTIRALLDARKVREALVEMRRHRVDMKLFYDHAPSLLLEPSAWLSTIADADVLVLLLNQLKGHPEFPSISSSLTSAVLSLPTPSPTRRSLFPVALTALLTRSPPDVAEAFALIVDNLPGDSSRSSLLREWLHVGSYFLAPSALFHAALATYDLRFVVEVVETLSIDPNEYLDTLNELHALSDDNYRRFRIDMLRNDYVSALRHLARDEKRLDEALALIETQKLHAAALEVYAESEQLPKVASIAAVEFERRAQWREAAIAARLARDYELEMRARERTGEMDEWAHALLLFAASEAEEKAAIEAMADKLLTAAKWNALWILRETTRGPWPSRLEAAEKAAEWKAVARIGQRDGQDAASESRRALSARATALQAESAATLAELHRLSGRLDVVRATKAQRMEALKEGDLLVGDMENVDAFSESSLLSSRSSRSRSSRSSAVSRRTKKIEKKKSSLKEGGEWEDAAILIVCHAKWMEARKILAESSSLVPSLCALRLLSYARSLSTALATLEKDLVGLQSRIWPARLSAQHLTGPLTSIYDIDGVVVAPSGDSSMPPSLALDPEMCPPPPLTEGEKAWRIGLV